MQTKPDWSSVLEDDSNDVRQAIIEVAGQLFAQRGYHQVSVREICKIAGANVAGVNYYFGNKKKLFFHVLKMAFETVQQDEAETFESLPAEQALRLFIDRTLRHVLTDDSPSWHQTLMLRVMHEDAELFQEAMHTVIRHEFEALLGIIRELVAASVDEKQLQLLCFSILGQCLFFHHNRMLVSIIAPEWVEDSSAIDALSEHIYQFSLKAITA